MDEETWNNVQRLRKTKHRPPKRSEQPHRLTGILYCADCGAKLTHRNNLVQDRWIDDAFTCSSYRRLTRDCIMHYIPTAKIEAAILTAIQRVSWYVQNNEKEFIQCVREASSLRQEEAIKNCKQSLSRANKRHAELDVLVKKLYEGNATGKIPDRHFTRLLAEYGEEQTALEASIAEWQGQHDTWNADRLNTDKFIELAKRYTDFTELTTPMLNEFIEKVIVHEGEGRGNSRRQRLDIYLNFIGAFEVPAEIVTPTELEEQRRQQEEQAAKEKRSKELEQARYEKRKQDKRDFTARKRGWITDPRGTGSGGSPYGATPRMAKGMTRQAKSRRAGEATQAPFSQRACRPKTRGRGAYAGGSGTPCGISQQEERSNQEMARKEVS